MKHIRAILLAAALLALSACGGQAGEDPAAATPPETTPPEATSAVTQPPDSPATTKPAQKMVDFYNDFRPQATPAPVFDEAPLLLQRLPFESDGLWGVIDGRGNVIIPPAYSCCVVLEEVERILCTGEVQRDILTCEDDRFTLHMERLPVVDIFDFEGNPVTLGNFDALYATRHYYRSGYWVNDYLIAQKNGLQGLIDLHGQVVVPIQYAQVGVADYGARIENVYVWGRAGKMGLWRVDCGQVAQAKYNAIYDTFFMEDGTVLFEAMKSAEEHGVYTLGDRCVLPLEAWDAIYYGGQSGFLILGEAEYIWLDQHFRELCRFSSDYQAVSHFSNFSHPDFVGDYVRFWHWNGSKTGCGLIDRQGQTVLYTADGYIYDEYDYDDNYNVLASRLKLTENGVTTYYSLDLEPLDYTPPSIDEGPLSQPPHIIMRDGKYGLLDDQGNTVLPFKYDSIFTAGNYYIAAMGDYSQRFRGVTLLDQNFEPVFDDAVEVDTGFLGAGFEDPAIIVRHKGQCRAYWASDLGHITGELFEDIRIGSLGIMSVQRGGKWAFLRTDGTYLTGFDFDEAGLMNEHGFAAVRVDGLWGSIDISGALSAPPYLPKDADHLTPWGLDHLIFIGRYYYFWDSSESRYTDALNPVSHFSA